MKIVIIKYNAGNLQSVCFALDRLGVAYEVSSDPQEIMSADKVIFPGVGEASTTMAFLKSRQLDRVITSLKQPVLGICLGMQLLCAHSEENDTPCLGIFDAVVKRFRPDQGLKVPHMGWNSLRSVSGWLPAQLENLYVYYVHSYYVPVTPHTVAQTHYFENFSAALQKDNFFAVQFHPEKSAFAGETVLRRWLEGVGK
jgi:glutamine amidotransferase